MRFLILSFFLACCVQLPAQTVFGYWYGTANVKTNNSANNYLVELILQPEKNSVKGILNYYFKDTYRSLPVKGDYDAANRQVNLYDIPVVYHGSIANMEVDCIMNMRGTLRVSQAGSYLTGIFVGLPEYRNTCPDISFNLEKNADISKQDSVIKAIREFREQKQVWTPAYSDSIIGVTLIPRKVINYVIEKEYTERENVVNNEIEVESDSLIVDFYDNGDVDGDTISIFMNNKLIAYHQRLSTKSIHFDFVLDSLYKVNEVTMFAENLGSIPPNTALMIIDDGKNRYQLRLSSTMDKNGTIRIKRKRDGVKAKL